MWALSSDGGVPGSGGGSWWAAPVRGRHAAAGPSEPDRSGRVVPDASGELGPVLPEVPAPLEPVEPVHTTGNSWCGSAPEPRARPAEPDRPTAPDRPGSTCPGPTEPEGPLPEPQARAAADRTVVPAPGAQGAGGYGFVPDASYGVMPSADPSAGQAQAGAADPTASALSYGRMPDSSRAAGLTPVVVSGCGRALSGGVPAGAVPPSPASVPVSSGRYGLMPAPATATTGPVMPATAGPGPVPVATAQASEAVSVSPSAVRPVGLSVNLGGAPVRLEWWEHLGGFLMRFRALRVLMRVRMVLTWVSLLVVGVALAVSPVARAVLGPGSVACGSWRSASGWRGARPSPGA